VTSKKKSKKDPPGFNTPFDALETLKKELEAKAAQSNERPKPAAPLPRPVATSRAEDELSFHRMMSGVVPLDQGLGRVAKSKTALERGSVKDAATRKAEALAQSAAETELVHDRLRELVDGDGRFEVEDDGKRVATTSAPTWSESSAAASCRSTRVSTSTATERARRRRLSRSSSAKSAHAASGACWSSTARASTRPAAMEFSAEKSRRGSRRGARASMSPRSPPPLITTAAKGRFTSS
jgi:hypothetical protein